ncbi:MAG TPA: BatA domain-containing protein, partial [Bacteroidales bacterium]|nr:BatA domain-containing protein [Bacteroidales bacterium]
MIRGIVFDSPGFLYLLALLPLMIFLYVIRYNKSSAALRVSSAEAFNNSGKTFRHILRHVLFGMRVAATGLLIIVLARPQATNSYQDVST